MDMSLCYAIDKNDMTNLKCLLSRGSNVNNKDIDGKTPIHRAAINGYHNIFFYLLEHGADINIIDNAGNTLLHNAVIGDNKEIVELLLKKGLNINSKNYKNLTVLELSEEWFSYNSKEILEKYGKN